MITVCIVDDHAIVREGVRLLLETQGDIEVISEASNGEEAKRRIIRSRPRIVVMDISIPVQNGITVMKEILDRYPDTKFVILSMHASIEYISRALEAGALGYVLKESVGKELIKAVRTVDKGRRYLSSKISKIILEEYPKSEIATEKPLIDRLSQRELELLQFVASGKTNAEIAKTLGISIKSVETYRSRLKIKLGISDVASLVKLAIQHGLSNLDT